jgi:hypothetical protein
MGEQKKLSIKEFREIGLLQEVNRLFFHPRGLALAINVEDNGDESLGYIIDSRDDPEGFLFGDTVSESMEQKAINVSNLLESKSAYRMKKCGFVIQPLSNKLSEI